MKRAVMIFLLIACGGEATERAESVDAATSANEPHQFAYGAQPSQFARLRRPANTQEKIAVVVLIHGGFWRDSFGLDLMTPLAADLESRGLAVWNIEYRRVGEEGGGYPGTLQDVVDAIRFLETLRSKYALDLQNVFFVGHSAGGHLALWAAAPPRVEGAPGSEFAVPPRLAIGLAPVTDLVAAAEQQLGANAAQALLGGEPDEQPDRYGLASPRAPVSNVRVVRGRNDFIVPRDVVIGQGGLYESALREFDDSDHFDVIDPSHPSWVYVVGEIQSAP